MVVKKRFAKSKPELLDNKPNGISNLGSMVVTGGIIIFGFITSIVFLVALFCFVMFGIFVILQFFSNFLGLHSIDLILIGLSLIIAIFGILIIMGVESESPLSGRLLFIFFLLCGLIGLINTLFILAKFLKFL